MSRTGDGAAENFARYIKARAKPWPGWTDLIDYPSDEEIRAELAGKDLACWCAPGKMCHADVLLRVANRETAASAAAQEVTR